MAATVLCKAPCCGGRITLRLDGSLTRRADGHWEFRIADTFTQGLRLHVRLCSRQP